MSLQWRMMQKLKRNWLVVLKLTWRTSQILTRALECLKNFCFLIGSLWELQKYRGVIFHDTEEMKKNVWRKTDLWFKKRIEKFGKFSPDHLKVSKLGLWWDPFVQSRKSMTLKFAEELCVMAMKNNAKFEEELTCHFKIHMRNLTNFDSSTWKSKKIALWLTPLTKVYNVWAKKSTEELCLIALKIDAKFKGKLTCAFKNDMRNLANMHRLK